MNKKMIAGELLKAAKELMAKYPPKAVDYNKLPDTDGFWEWPLDEAKKYSGASYSRARDIGGLIMFLNMAAGAWEKTGSKKAKDMTAATGIRDRLDAAEKMAKSGGRGLELARREIDSVARDAEALSKDIWKIMNEKGRGSDAAGYSAERAVQEALKEAL